ncbi:MAG: cytochrome c oxidase assembly protein [Gammaproteobacteria bacterium RIFCSPHIGHO2_12_FULL_42_10]|nr:MAG: cytochrome c oxidase assembly protein [Gammaproteobacteria bacterium RIFCSPHIGHO2_12_FULL_42_10]
MPERRPHRRVYTIAGIAALVMFSFCFAMVPVYNIICRKTGINTSAANGDLLKPMSAEEAAQSPDLSRDVEIQFTSISHMGLPWDFYPQTKSIRVHPGANARVYFYAKNTTDKMMTVQAVPSITPPESISHFHKIECFCFTHQTLAGHASKEMPLVFHIDRNLPKNVRVITLAYTLFPVSTKRY